MKVSYLVALYNKEKYIKQCIDSILDEESPNLEIEVCIVDDGSSDNSWDVVNKNYGADNRVRLEKFLTNRGKNAAYNACFNMASGDAFAVVGADDYLVKGRTKALLSNSKETYWASYGNMLVLDEASDEIVGQIRHVRAKYPEILVNNTLSGGACVFSKECGDNIFPIPEYLKFEDWWISVVLVKLTAVRVIDKPVLVYRIHSGNDIGGMVRDYKKIYKDYSRHEEYLDALEELVDDESGRKYLEKARAMRAAFFGEKKLKYLFLMPIDLHWIKTCWFMLIGPKSYYKVIAFVKRVR